MFDGHIFYDTRELTLSDKIKIIQEAKRISYKWWVDKLDCTISWTRQEL